MFLPFCIAILIKNCCVMNTCNDGINFELPCTSLCMLTPCHSTFFPIGSFWYHKTASIFCPLLFVLLLLLWIDVFSLCTWDETTLI